MPKTWPSKTPHFELTCDLVNSIARKEAIATVEALSECNLLSFPYPCFTLSFDWETFLTSKGWVGAPQSLIDEMREPGDTIKVTACVAGPVELIYDDKRPALVYSVNQVVLFERANGQWYELNILTGKVDPYNDVFSEGVRGTVDKAINDHVMLLLVALATKTTVLSTSRNSYAKLGKGFGNMRCAGTGHTVFVSRTIVDVPACVATGTGKRMPRHLRRGHVHRWKTKEGHVSKFLPPIWVNDALSGGDEQPKYKVHGG
jgi:hypothetical protein